MLLGTGVKAAVFNAVGTTPVPRESLTMLRTAGHKESKQDLNKLVGRGSSTQVVAFIRDTSLVSSSESIWEKVVNNVPWKQDGQTVEDKMGAA